MSNLLTSLNNEQLKAVTHTGGPLLIIAGAGTGKTSVITRRIAWLIEGKKAKPEEILALTFTDKAATEMEERVHRLIELGTYDLWISTFHSFCQRILEQHGLDVGLANSFKLMDDVQQWIMLHRNFDKFKLKYYRPLGSPNKFIDAMLDHFSKCKDEMITPDEYLQYAEQFKKGIAAGDEEMSAEAKRLDEIANAYKTYQQLLLDSERIDFADLIHYTIKLFETRPNILSYYRNHFKYILVDEFQDTNYAQYRLISLLTAKNKDGHYANNLVVVGDDDQSIYKFRGASVSNILKLQTDFPKLSQMALVENYRSAQGILDKAYQLIQTNNPDRLEVKSGINKQLRANIIEPAVIEVIEGGDMAEELGLVIKKIQELKKEGNVSWNDFAVLVRANSSAEEIIHRLESSGIPFTYLANKGLYKKPIISNLVNYFRLLDNYHESSALYRVMGMEKFAIDLNELALIGNYAKKKTLSFYEALSEVDKIPGITERTLEKVQTLLETLSKHSAELFDKPAIELFVQIIADLGLYKPLSSQTVESTQDVDYLDQFYKKMLLFTETSEDKSLHAFMEALDIELLAGNEGQIKFDPNSGPESLKVLTVHSAKGLEFKYVFIVGLVDQRFPSRSKPDPIEIPAALIKDILPEGDAHIQEERRLFYVAMTRAKTNLYLSWAKDYGGARSKKPSIFLKELGLVSDVETNSATGKALFAAKPSSSRKQIYQVLPTRFSFSDISTFENCPFEYKYKNYLKLPMPGSPHLSFGQTIHKVLQAIADHYRLETNARNKVPSKSAIARWYKEFWIDEWYHTKSEKEDYRSEGERMITVMCNDLKTLKPTVKYAEQPFELKMGDYTINGRIDRADLAEDGRLIIVDYKTGKSKTKNKRDVDQLRLYQWAAEEALGDSVGGLMYWYLKDNLKAEQELANQAELDALKTSVQMTIDKIHNTIKYDLFEEEHATTKQHQCKYSNLI